MSITTPSERPRNPVGHVAALVGMREPASRCRNVAQQPVRAGTRLMAMAATVLIGVAPVLLTSGPGWPSRPTLPGDWFQLAAGAGTMPPMHATNESVAQARPTRSEYPMARTAKGEGWM